MSKDPAIAFAYVLQQIRGTDLGLVQIVQEREDFVRNLDNEFLLKVERAYEEIAAKGLARQISDYTREYYQSGHGDSSIVRQLFLLFLLFEELGRQGVAPFSDGRVAHVPEELPNFRGGELPAVLLPFLRLAVKHWDKMQQNSLEELAIELSPSDRDDFVALAQHTRDAYIAIESFKHIPKYHSEKFALFGVIELVQRCAGTWED